MTFMQIKIFKNFGYFFSDLEDFQIEIRIESPNNPRPVYKPEIANLGYPWTRSNSRAGLRRYRIFEYLSSQYLSGLCSR